MSYTAADVLQFVEESDVKFVRLAFCTPFGVQKNMAIMADQLPRALDVGIPFDAHTALGLVDISRSDLVLHPDPSTLHMLPWRPQHGAVVNLFCDIAHTDGSVFACDGRAVLKTVIRRVKEAGYVPKIGPSCEFYLFMPDEYGNPTRVPHDRGGYFDIGPLDRGENIRREICLTLEQMGLIPESSHHEAGPGQHEIDFQYADALVSAENFLTFKRVVRTVAAQNGVFASFMPKPLPDKNGSGLHVNVSLFQDGANIFAAEGPPASPAAQSFIQGVLDRAAEMTPFLNTLPNSYLRLGRFNAPRNISWSRAGRSALVRIPTAQGAACRMELRSPDPACNPYLAFALILAAGLEGMEQNKTLCEACENAAPELMTDTGARALPADLAAAVQLARSSCFIDSVLPATLRDFILDAQEQSHSRLSADPNAQSTEDAQLFPYL